MAKGVKVYCTTLNKWFKNIRKAARFAGVNDWTMSKKMEVSGGFIDSNGNEYIRQRPMDTKNTYEDTGKTVKKGMGRKKKNTRKKKEQFFPMIDELLKQPEKKIVFGDYPVAVQKVIEEHAKDMLQKGTPFAEVKSFLIDAGCTKLTINLIEGDNGK